MTSQQLCEAVRRLINSANASQPEREACESARDVLEELLEEYQMRLRSIPTDKFGGF